MEQTTERRWHEVWREQCEAAETIRLRHGVGSAFEPHRVCRRPFCLSHAAMSDCSSMA